MAAQLDNLTGVLIDEAASPAGRQQNQWPRSRSCRLTGFEAGKQARSHSTFTTAGQPKPTREVSGPWPVTLIWVNSPHPRVWSQPDSGKQRAGSDNLPRQKPQHGSLPTIGFLEGGWQAPSGRKSSSGCRSRWRCSRNPCRCRDVAHFQPAEFKTFLRSLSVAGATPEYLKTPAAYSPAGSPSPMSTDEVFAATGWICWPCCHASRAEHGCISVVRRADSHHGESGATRHSGPSTLPS